MSFLSNKFLYLFFPMQHTHAASLEEPPSNVYDPTILLELNTLCSGLLNKHMKRCSNSVSGKLITKYHHAAKIECMCQLGLGVTRSHMPCCWNVRYYFHFRKPSAICTCKTISFDDLLNWSLSASDGRPPCSSFQGSRLFCKTSWNTTALYMH